MGWLRTVWIKALAQIDQVEMSLAAFYTGLGSLSFRLQWLSDMSKSP